MWGWKDVWDSGLKVVKEVKVRIPLKILLVCREIQKHVGHKEFSILARGEWTTEGFEVSEEYIVPEQEVTSSSVDYKEDLGQYKAQGFNVVIHSHPWGGNTDFSHTDEETINTHFDCSILFNGSEFVKAVISIQINTNIKLQIPAKIEISYPTISIPAEQIQKIKEKKIEIPITWKKKTKFDDDYLLF